MAQKVVVQRPIVCAEAKPRDKEVLNVSVDGAPIGLHVIFHKQLTLELSGGEAVRLERDVRPGCDLKV